jgi:NTE family protein
VTAVPSADRDEVATHDPFGDRVLAAMPERATAPTPGELDRRPRIGMVFGAGGVQGNAYLAGAVAALHEVTGFEPRGSSVLVGTSAGSVHAAMYGAGIPALFPLWRNRGGRIPDDLYLDDASADAALGAPAEEPWIDPGEEQTLREIFTPARALPRIGPAAPMLALRSLARPWTARPEVLLTALLPEGILTNTVIGHAIRRMVPSGWVPHPRTWITTVNLRTGNRVVFGQPGSPRAHLDRAVRASCAIPGVYRPVRVGRDRYVDGGMHSPSNADLVAGLDLDLVIVINPMSSLEGIAATGVVDRYLSRMRHFAGSRLGRELAAIHEHDVPTLVVQPTARDLQEFSRNLMDARPRRRIAERALETTMQTLQGPAAAEATRTLRLAAAAAAEA